MAGSVSPQAGVRGVHIRQDLTNLSVGYTPDNMTLIADQVFKPFPVKYESDLYYVAVKGQRFNLIRSDGQGDLVADGTRPKELSFGWTKANYECEERGHAVRITDRERANADSSLQLETSRVSDVRGIVRLNYEVRVATAMLAYSSYASANKITLSGTDQWNNASFVSKPTSGPNQSVIAQRFLDGISAVVASTGGVMPNTAIIPWQVFNVMRNDQGINEFVKFNENIIATGNPFRNNFLGLTNIYIPTGMSQTVTEGEATNLGYIWGKDVWIGYVNPNPGLKMLTIGLTFQQRAWNVKSWREEGESSTMYAPTAVQDERVVSYDCGYIIHNAVA